MDLKALCECNIRSFIDQVCKEIQNPNTTSAWDNGMDFSDSMGTSPSTRSCFLRSSTPDIMTLHHPTKQLQRQTSCTHQQFSRIIKFWQSDRCFFFINDSLTDAKGLTATKAILLILNQLSWFTRYKEEIET